MCARPWRKVSLRAKSSIFSRSAARRTPLLFVFGSMTRAMRPDDHLFFSQWHCLMLSPLITTFGPCIRFIAVHTCDLNQPRVSSTCHTTTNNLKQQTNNLNNNLNNNSKQPTSTTTTHCHSCSCLLVVAVFSPVPPTVSDQILLWEQETSRLTQTEGVLFRHLPKQLFPDLLAFAQEQQACIWYDASKSALIVSEDARIDMKKKYKELKQQLPATTTEPS